MQALPHIIQKMSNITLQKETKGRNQNEYWYEGTCKNVSLDNIPYNITVKLVKKANVQNPQFYVYFVNDILIKKIN
jgi:16S rRNA A1518/A1519 N6-dimethyltransferase RsmA/KsgA/DIM1 with predicted DNA glycosylase/AP lyase activity